MRNSSWAALLRHIPAELHNNLMLMTTAGIEIIVNNLLRIEQEYVVFRGRLAGSQESGKLLFVPYANIDYFGFTKSIKDSDFEETFGSFTPPDTEAATPAVVEPTAAAVPAIGMRGPTPIKSAVLERFRSRTTTIMGSAVGTPLAPSTQGTPRPES